MNRSAPLQTDPEERLAQAFSAEQRRREGIFFTPAALVAHTLQTCARYVPCDQPLTIVDPSCGAGAFLVDARRRFPAARLLGLERDPASARTCRERLPDAQVLEGDGLRGGFERLCAALPPGAVELWVGNPPYNGTSSVLGDPALFERLCATLPGIDLPRGTSLRDDYAFFLLLAAKRLRDRPGALAFVTSASLLDAFLYAPVRRALLQTLALREVHELGGRVFSGTRVRTAVTIWTSPGPTLAPAGYRRRAEGSGFSAEQLGPPSAFSPAAPDWSLRAEDPDAAGLDREWRANGEPLDLLVPVSFAGLKTRFDELLVDDDPHRLLRRVAAFLEASPRDLEAFAERHGLSLKLVPKLRALRAYAGRATASPTRLRRFLRYAGARHRGGIPEEAMAYCYLDRALIPRGDHRLQGEYDPHACPRKLVFNLRELPLAATTVSVPGCVHMHRHARFAPLWVPERSSADARYIPNLSAAGLELAARAGGPWKLFERIARFINSEPVQQVWAPAYGAARVLPVPFKALV